MGKYLLIYALVASAFILKGVESVRKLDPFSVPPPTYNPFDDEELEEKLMELNDLKMTKDRNTDITTRYIWGKQVIKIMNKMTDVTSRQVTLAIKDAFWDLVDSHFGVTRQIVRNTEKNCHSTPRRQLRLRFYYQALLEKTMDQCVPNHRVAAIEIDKDLQPVIRNLTQVFSKVEYCVDDDQRQRIKKQELGISMDLTSRKRRLAPLLVAIAGEIAVEAAIALLDFLIEKLFGWFTEWFKCIKGDDAKMAEYTLPNLRDVARRASKLLTETWKKSKDCVGGLVQNENSNKMQRLVDKCRSSVVYGSNEIRYSEFLSVESEETQAILKNQSLVPLPQRE